MLQLMHFKRSTSNTMFQTLKMEFFQKHSNNYAASLNAPEQNNSLPQGPVVAKEPKRTAPVVEDAKNQQSGGQQQENTEAGKSKAQLRAERRQIQVRLGLRVVDEHLKTRVCRTFWTSVYRT